MDGLTPISEYGMSDWFKDNLKNAINIIGSYDQKKKEYNVTIVNGKKVESKAPPGITIQDIDDLNFGQLAGAVELNTDVDGNPLPGSENFVFDLLSIIQTTFVNQEFFELATESNVNLSNFFIRELIDRGLDPLDYGAVTLIQSHPDFPFGYSYSELIANIIN